jgi:hypothetical protein
MNRMAKILPALPLCAALAFAQTSGAQGQPQNQNQQPQNQHQSTGQGDKQHQQHQTQSRQTGTMQDIGSGQYWYGILVDARCSGSGMTGTSGGASTHTGSGQVGGESMMHRNTPGATSDRTWNTTDRNTAGTADRGATGTGSASNPDMNRRTPDATTGMDRRDQRTTGQTGSTGQMDRPDQRTTGQTGSTGQTDRTDNRATSADPRHDQDHRAATHSSQQGQVGSAAAARSTAGSTDHSGASASNPGTATGQQHQTGTADRQNQNWWSTTGDVATADQAGNWTSSCFITPTSTSFVLHTQDGRMIRLDDASNSRIVSQLQNTQRVQNAHKIFRVKVRGSMSGDQFSITDIEM